MKCSLGVSNFLEEISSLSHSNAFLYLFSLITEEGFISFFFSAICKASSDNYFAFCIFFPLGMVLIAASYTVSQTSVHSSSGTLSIRSNALNILSLPLYNCKGFDLGQSGFPYFFQFKSDFGNKEFMIWATVSSQSCFCWLYRASPSLAAKNMINLNSVLTIWWCPCVESSLVLLEEGVCYDQCVLLAKLY